jgi:hypothetical protein
MPMAYPMAKQISAINARVYRPEDESSSNGETGAGRDLAI